MVFPYPSLEMNVNSYSVLDRISKESQVSVSTALILQIMATVAFVSRDAAGLRFSDLSVRGFH